ncbi:MAG: TIGR00282 family metallophosphoesterase [Clostridiales bacterium]|nr:TIGR00282 family metallophosphoesterase [Clostridiales bacterium]
MVRVLFIGDIYGNLGRKTLKKYIADIKREKNADFCIVNGENSASGRGITYAIASEFYKLGVDCITLGNHTWGKNDILNFIDDDAKMVRPANYPIGSPGQGSRVIENDKGLKIGVVNVLGRVYMDGVDCPFKAIEREVSYLKKFVKVVIVDVHAEATSEKCAIAWDFDGKVSAILGTHTHVQTSDERILPFGTAFLTDVGMTGPYDGVIGVDRNIIIKRLKTAMPQKFESATGLSQLNGVCLDIDENTGKAMAIERISYKALDVK